MQERLPKKVYKKLKQTIEEGTELDIETCLLYTSKMLTRELRVELEKIFVKGKDFKNLYITVMSFGFKYGIPQDADLVFDVRFLPNPYYIEELRAKTGNEAEVRDYVMKSDKAQEFFRQLSQMMDFLIPNYILEGKNQLCLLYTSVLVCI